MLTPDIAADAGRSTYGGGAIEAAVDGEGAGLSMVVEDGRPGFDCGTVEVAMPPAFPSPGRVHPVGTRGHGW